MIAGIIIVVFLGIIGIAMALAIYKTNQWKKEDEARKIAVMKYDELKVEKKEDRVKAFVLGRKFAQSQGHDMVYAKRVDDWESAEAINFVDEEKSQVVAFTECPLDDAEQAIWDDIWNEWVENRKQFND
jgi:hypothetical protein